MAPAHQAQPPFSTNEKVLCFHHEMLYDAKILEVRQSAEKEGKPTYEYRVHYKGWKNTWDDWVPSDRIRPINDENRLLQNQLKIDITGTDSRRSQAQKPPAPSKKGRGQGSEMGSGRGSEDPNGNLGGRRRGKDNDIEKVGDDFNSNLGDPKSLSYGPIIPTTVANFADTFVIPVFTGQRLDDSACISFATPPVSSPILGREGSVSSSSNRGHETPRFHCSSTPSWTATTFAVSSRTGRRNNGVCGARREKMGQQEKAPRKSIAEMTFEEIDAEFEHRSPPDPAEHMERDEIKRTHPNAPLISGTIGSDPQHSIKIHSYLPRALVETNHFAHKIQFFRACDPDHPKAYIAGIPPASMQHVFDPPGYDSRLQINLQKSSFRELRLPTIIYHIAKAKTKKALKKFIQGLVEQIPIDNPPKWDYHPPCQKSTATFEDHMDDLDADQELVKYLDSLTVAGVVKKIVRSGRRTPEENHLDIQEAITTTNAVLIIQMCQVLTKLPGVQEDQYRLKPMVRIPVPEHLKYLLVDDWENITKNLQLVELPSKRPVNFILDEYFTQKRNDRPLGSADAAILEEFHSGMKVYFQKALGKLLLYRFERDQYADLQKYWTTNGIRCEDVDGNSVQYKSLTPGDIYGGEHLLRLIVSFPELIAQTNMDAPSVARLREEIMRFTTWLSQNANVNFINKYVGATQEYIERATASGN